MGAGRLEEQGGEDPTSVGGVRARERHFADGHVEGKEIREGRLILT